MFAQMHRLYQFIMNKPDNKRSTDMGSGSGELSHREQCIQHYEAFLGSLYRVDHENPERSSTPEQFYRWSTGTRDRVTVTRQDVLNWLATTGNLIVDGEEHILGEYCPLGVNLGEYDITVDNFNWADYGMSDTPDARDLMSTTTVMPTESATTVMPTESATTVMPTESATTVPMLQTESYNGNEIQR